MINKCRMRWCSGFKSFIPSTCLKHLNQTTIISDAPFRSNKQNNEKKQILFWASFITNSADDSSMFDEVNLKRHSEQGLAWTLATWEWTILHSPARSKQLQYWKPAWNSMDRPYTKPPATWVLPVSIAFAGLCIFGAGLVIHEPLEKIATRQSHTIVIEHRTAEFRSSTPNRRWSRLDVLTWSTQQSADWSQKAKPVGNQLTEARKPNQWASNSFTKLRRRSGRRRNAECSSSFTQPLAKALLNQVLTHA